MNISSLDKPRSRPARELEELLQQIDELKRKLRVLSGNTGKDSYQDLVEDLNGVENSLHGYLQRYFIMTRALETATSIKLTEKQRMILQWLKEKYSDPDIYTKLIEKISTELKIAKSTVRWNLRGLREADLIEAGSKDNKGIPVSLTSTGRIMANYIVEAS
ncbi:MAG: hypothetical protein ACLFVP_05790 [Candidatus Bathyarchaeia archaeon]